MRSFKSFVCWANLRSSQRSNASQDKRDMAEYETAGIRRKGVRVRLYTYIARLSTRRTILEHYVPRGGHGGSPAMLVRPWRRLIPGREGDMYRAQVGWAAGTEDAMIAGVQFGRSSNASSYLRSLAPDLCPRHFDRTSHFTVTFTIYPSLSPPPSSAPWVVSCSR